MNDEVALNLIEVGLRRSDANIKVAKTKLLQLTDELRRVTSEIALESQKIAQLENIMEILKNEGGNEKALLMRPHNRS